MLGNSFIRMLSELNDLALIMDESHHYRAEKGAAALNDLKPLLGLELTATPLVTKGKKQIPFKNVVYEYPLSYAIRDGFTRTPFAVTRSDVKVFDFGDEQLDKLMLTDRITCHENVKRQLAAFAANNQKPQVKPFMLVVCKDTGHAEWVKNYVCSDAFCGGRYANKTLVVHSHQKSAESEANTRALLGVENPDNPIEIVIHVNTLKEGWDVNNLYTIVPLRTAASKILREQMVGRGLRLPYGVRTGERDVDAVFLTAHDRFEEILAEAQRGDSIFRAENVIKAEDLAPVHTIVAQPALDFDMDLESIDYDRCSDLLFKLINQVCDHYRAQFELNGLKNIVMMYQRQIARSIYEQMLRPHPKEFNIYYNHGRRYEPDFVVETLQKNYLVEVKGKDKLKEPEVIAKKERGVQCCETASRGAKANGFKEWQYLFIPAGQIYSNSTFHALANQFSI